MEQLNKKQWAQLKNAVLCAKYNSSNPSEEFDNLSKELKNHEIGLLVSSYICNGNSESLVKAAKLLAPETENYWVALERA